MRGRTIVGFSLFAVLTAGAIAISPVICGRREQVMDAVSPDFVLGNYRWFKNQSAAIQQVNAQIASIDSEIVGYRRNFEGMPFALWPFDAREELSRKEAIKRGYISQYNMLAGQYNARKSDFTRGWTEGEMPDTLQLFMKDYSLR